PRNAAPAPAATLLPPPGLVAAPGMRELSLGRGNHQAGTAKLALFAYDRVTREPVWQAGVKRGASDIRDTWFMGLGPYHYRPKRNKGFWRGKEDPAAAEITAESLSAYSSPILFERAVRPPAE